MAEKYHEIDKIFREKLASHAIAPSPMSWEKLESRLSKEKKGMVSWTRIAAAVLLLLGLSALLWQGSRVNPGELKPLAEAASDQEVIQEQGPYVTETQGLPDQEKRETSSVIKLSAKKNPQKIIAQNDNPVEATEERGFQEEDIPAITILGPIDLPPLDPGLLVTENSLELPEAEATQGVEYTITIISNGIRYTPEKETLVGEIEHKIDQLGGLISKVDQGFADLQDAKNNWFASITTKR